MAVYPRAGGVMPAQTLGVDISARWFDVAHGGGVRRFPNTSEGITTCLNTHHTRRQAPQFSQDVGTPG